MLLVLTIRTKIIQERAAIQTGPEFFHTFSINFARFYSLTEQVNKYKLLSVKCLAASQMYLPLRQK